MKKLQIKTLISDRWATVRYPTSSSGSVGAFNSTSGTQRDWRHLNSRSINTSYELYENNLIGFDFSYFSTKEPPEMLVVEILTGGKKENYNYYYQVKNFTFSTISVDAKIGYEYLDETSNYHKNASSYATDYGHKTYIDSIYGMLALNFQENFFADIAFRKDDVNIMEQHIVQQYFYQNIFLKPLKFEVDLVKALNIQAFMKHTV